VHAVVGTLGNFPVTEKVMLEPVHAYALFRVMTCLASV
jgi:hypothetical protein